jgi:type III pantothenate kinase
MQILDDEVIESDQNSAEAAMLLCFDIGNTNIKIGVFEGDRLIRRWRLATDRERLADEYAVLVGSLFNAEDLHLDQIDGCAISSVVPSLTDTISEFSRRYLHLEPLILRHDTPIGMRINTEYPAEVGPDLIVNAFAARHLYGTPLIVIGFGTATTFSAVSETGDFEGVAIAPGIITAGESLFRATATLPRIALSRPPTAVGKNTIRSLQSGLVFGFTGLVEALVKRIQPELGGEAKVIATGGLATLIAPETKVINVVEPDLALIGLRLIYEKVKR